MSRVLLQYALPLLLPTLLYLLWWSVIGRKKAATAGGGGVLAQGPWFALSLCGVFFSPAASSMSPLSPALTPTRPGKSDTSRRRSRMVASYPVTSKRPANGIGDDRTARAGQRRRHVGG